MSSQRPDWDTYFKAIARAVARRADCTRRQVGAVIVDPDHRIIATGYNGAPAGKPGCLSDGACPRGQHYPYAMSPGECVCGEEWPCPVSGDHGSSYANCTASHAEMNAILYARSDLRGCTLYVTDEPCYMCTRLIDSAGVTKVITPQTLNPVR